MCVVSCRLASSRSDSLAGVVVGDGAVGKVRSTRCFALYCCSHVSFAADLSVDIVHHKRVSCMFHIIRHSGPN